MKRSIAFAALLGAVVPFAALAQTAEDLRNDGKTPGDVLVYGMGYAGERFSPLTQINKDTVRRLVPVWAYSLSDLQGGEAFPIVKDGVIYITTHNATAAVDALTGRQIWRVLHEYPPETLRVVCCGIVNRGAAIYQGMIIRALMDDRLVALDAKTGKEIWSVKSPDPVTYANGYAMTGAPLIVDGIVIMGVAGAEYSHRGLLEGYDAKTGKHLWRLYTIPAKGEPGSETWEGDSELTGGGSSWVTGTYDPELDLVYWGIGNPSPWNPRARQGDNLFTNSIFAVRPKTGERVWYFQTTPNDPFDYDAVQTPVIALIKVNGEPRKVVMQANRGGFLYVLDAKDGKLIAANAFGKVTWANGVDLETGRPNVTDVFRGALEGKKVTVWPSVSGVTNWQHMSFSPLTGLLYINTLHVGMTYEAPEPPKLAPGKPSGPGTVKRTTVTDDPNVRGYLKAVDPLTGKAKWEVPYRSPNYSSTLVTASNLVFTGVMTGEFQAVDADSGKILWSFQTPSGIVGQPVTWERNNKQYVTVLSGIGGVYAQRAGDPALENAPAGVSLWTFALFDQ
ncbi:MAG: PQQ-dependent dehydrogenase, methanol/ethanol family [Hyphomicrobiales bacterium]|nr:PQQ-dependent dehydrogenase, methanol/ethanol family [Hyphomicrobiales bacterium]MBV9427053.1 PQQ-dependent dehydrogenase, methanol/ethanol family [Bradyrhizobiaceae bacterium]